jgi:uncharacterized Rmd1/YagE family protein
MAERLSGGRARFHARAWYLGERIDVRALERGETLALLPTTVHAGERGFAVLFRYGAVVLIDLSPVEEAAFLEALAPFVTGRLEEPESEEADIAIEPQGDERVDRFGTLLLHEVSVERLQVIALILAKSVVLTHYEERVAAVFERIEPLTEGLRRGRWSGISSRRLLNQIGDVLLTQTRMVGRVEVTEKPEITWDRPVLDRLYDRLVTEYELRERDVALTRKLEIVSRIAETYLELLQNRRSLRVEWYIVLLILVEILIYLYELLAH